MTLFPGIEFDEDKHEYWYNGKQFQGVTALISRKLGLKIPQEFVEEHQLEGIHVHHAIQQWIKTGVRESIHPGVVWLTDTFYTERPKPAGLYSEVLVSDLTRYASAVDIISQNDNSSLDIFDIKKGVFKREYVTWQLSIYKYFIEKYARRSVNDCVCICMKDKEYYDIFPKSHEQVEKLLYL